MEIFFNNLFQNILEKKQTKFSFNQYIENWPQNNSEGKFVATPKTLRQGLWDCGPLVMGTIKKKKKDSTRAWTINQNINQRAGVLYTENTKNVN